MSRRDESLNGLLHRRCGEVLHYLWDPIGVAGDPDARDEYAAYVPPVCAHLRDGAGVGAISDYLGLVVREVMGLEPNVERDLRAAKALLAWADRLQSRPMTESDFWSQLEFRFSREMARQGEGGRLGLWCDGIHPQSFQGGSREPGISGEAWVGQGSHDQEQWSFRLILPDSVGDRAAIDWGRLLPANDVTGWLSLDRSRRHMTLDPGAGVTESG